MSDHPGFFAYFAKKWEVSNAHLHKFPFLDLFSVPDEAKGSFEFVVCSDVLEHVAGSPRLALEGSWALLRPGGSAVVTVPIADSIATVEHYPGLVEFDIEEGPSVRWKDVNGVERVDDNPEMHGGDGLVLTFRRYGKADFKDLLSSAGFTGIQYGPVNRLLGVGALPANEESGVFVLWKA